MATYYLNLESGDDTKDGTTWANAWKTLNNGATAARIAPGDEIRIAKTADPVSIGNATWTNKSATVTLATAQTTNIYLDGSWTASNSGTATTNTSCKQGSNCSQITTASTTTTSTKYAYYATGTLDLSSYDAITFWIQNPSVVINANNYQIKLCSDTTGDTAVDTFDIPAIPSTSEWVPLTLSRNGGGALGNSIKSIALYTGTSSPGNSHQVRIDNVSGCDIDGLNLQSIISKSSTAYTTTETWHGLQSIDGTTLVIGNANNNTNTATQLKGYYTFGTSPETVTTYFIKTVKFDMAANDTEVKQPLQDSGTAGNLITYSGGWNTSNTTQDGFTWIDGVNGKGYGISGASRDYWKIERLGLVRFRQGINNNAVRTGCVVADTRIINCIGAGSLDFKDSTIDIIVNNCQTNVNTLSTATNNSISVIGYNFWQSSSFQGGGYFRECKVYNQGSDLGLAPTDGLKINQLVYQDSTGLVSFNSHRGIFVNDFTIKDNTGTTGVNNFGLVIINKLTASNNAALGTSQFSMIVKQTNATSSQLVGSGVDTSTRALTFASQYNAVNNVVTDNRAYWRYGNALSQTTTRKTASGVAWQINITNTAQAVNFPFNYPIAKVACNANALVTVKAWVKLSHATDIGAKLMIQANEIAGVSADVTATKAADTNWEELTITFTPTVAGVAQIYVQGYWLANLADESIYVDDVTITQA